MTYGECELEKKMLEAWLKIAAAQIEKRSYFIPVPDWQLLRIGFLIRRWNGKAKKHKKLNFRWT